MRMPYFRSIYFQIIYASSYLGTQCTLRQLSTYSHFSWTGLFLGGNQNWQHIHILSPITYNCPTLNQRKGENRNYFMITFHEAMWPGWGSNSWPLYMTDKESAKKPTALLAPIAGTQTHDPSTTDKKSSALPTSPLLGPAETNTHRFSWLYPSYKRVDIVLF